MKTLGVISDTHGLLRPEAVDALHGCDAIVHAGDIGRRGVLTALGAHRNGVLSMFLGTGLLIGVIGSLLGLLGGWLFTKNVNGVKDFLEDNFGVQIFPPDIYLFDQIPTVWHWPTVFWIMGGSILVSFFAGFIPALRASRMDPVKALRYE